MTKLSEYALVGGVVAVIAAGIIGYQSVLHKGEVKVLTHQADSTLKVRQDSSAQAIRDTIAASKLVAASKDSLAQSLALSRAQKKMADSSAKVASDERESARRLLADSSASLVQLRGALVQLVDGGRRDSAAMAERARRDSISIRSALATISADSLQHAGDVTALRLMEGRAQSAERLAELLKQQMPSKLAGRLGVGAGYGCVVHDGKVVCGTSLAANVRVFP